MAVKIISQPTRPNPEDRPVYTRTCPECGCKFTYQFEDCQENNYRGGYVEIRCPFCGYKVAHIIGGAGEDVNKPVKEM
jgi:hypothetical protein